jgi:Bacteroidetes VLRF1 release factor
MPKVIQYEGSNYAFKHIKDLRLDEKQVILKDLDQATVFLPSKILTDIRQTPTSSRTCSKCPSFCYTSIDDLRTHWKSSWHLFNQQMNKQVTEQEFLDQKDSTSSTSSSDYEEESVEDEPHVLFDNVIHVPVTKSQDAFILKRFLPFLKPLLKPEKSYLSVILFRAGKFAVGIFSLVNFNIVNHTTEKKYTVRAKQGGSQAKHDSSKNRSANSIGAQIRREQAKVLDLKIETLLSQEWKDFISDSILLYAGSKEGRWVVQGALDKAHVKEPLVGIPMNVRDPSHKEILRVWEELIGIYVKQHS